MHDTTEETSTHTVGNAKEERGFRSSWVNTGTGGWQKGRRDEGEDDVVKARWSFNAGAAVGALPDDFDDYDDCDEEEDVKARWSFRAGALPADVEEEEEEEEERVKARWSFNAGANAGALPEGFDAENELWSPSGKAKPKVSMIEEDLPETEQLETSELEMSENSFGQPSPMTPRKTIKSESRKDDKKIGSPSRRYVPNPAIPRIPTESSNKGSDDIPDPPKRMYMELCEENCESEFRKMTLEAHSLSPRLRAPQKTINASTSLTLSAAHRKRPSVKGVLQKQKSKSMERRNSIRDSLRNLDF